jgi:hypothetical protein
MPETGPDPKLLAKLEALDPREELVIRIALRELHDSVRGDRSFGDRIRNLLEQLDPRPQEMAAILAEAREAGKSMVPDGDGDSNAQAVPPRRRRRSF